MKSKLRRILAWTLVFILMSADICAVASTLNLPGALQIIDDEAFYGSTSMDKVVVPDTVREIRSKAFAYSSITEINLPETIEYIANDAFEGCENLTVYAPEGSYAHQWLCLSDVNYVIIDDGVELPVYTVSGVTLVTETDEAGEQQLYIGANVTADGDCFLSLSILDDETENPLFNASAAVDAPVQDAFIQAAVTIDLPEYYILEAVLVDEQGAVLSDYARSLTATSAYAELEEKTAEDYPAERTVDFGSSGFAVLAEGVRALNIDAEFDGKSYTFSTEESLKKGDVIQLQADGLVHVIKVASVSKNGGSVTVTADENVYLSEMFDAVNVSGSFVRGVAARSAGGPLISLNQTFKLDPLEFSYQVDMDISLSYKYDKHILDDFVLDVVIDTDSSFRGALTADIDTFKDNMHNGGSAWRIPIISEIVVLPGIYLPAYLNVSIPLNIKAEAGGSFGLGCQTTYGFTLSEANGFSARKEEGDRDADLKFEGDIEITFGPEVSLTASLFKAIEAKVGAQFGPKVTGTLETPGYGGTTAEKVHACTACLDMDVYAVADVRATVVYEIGEWMEGSLLDVQIAAYEKHLGAAFASIINEKQSIYGGKPKFGWDECQNYKYRAIVNTVDMYGAPAADIPVTVSRSGFADITGPSPLRTYLYNGNYTAKADFASGLQKEAFVVKDEAADVTVYEPGVDLSGYITDYTTGKPVSEATVSLAAPGNRTVSVQTDSKGYYFAEGMPFGAYVYEISAKKYESKTVSITIMPGADGHVDCELEPTVPDPGSAAYATAQARLQGEDIDVQGRTFSGAYVYDMRYTGYGYTASMGEATFNLKGRYGTMFFDVGFYEGWERNAVLKIYTDGILMLEDELKYTDAPIGYSIPVSGVHQLVIRMESPGYDYCRYAVGNILLSPARTQNDRVIQSDEDFDSYCSGGQQVDLYTGAFSMGGNNYSGGYQLHMGYGWTTSNTAKIGFDLGGEANTFSFDIAKVMKRIPEAYLDPCYITIEVDGVVQSGYEKREMKWNDLALPVSLNVSGANNVQITLNYYCYDRGYWGIGNIHVD